MLFIININNVLRNSNTLITYICITKPNKYIMKAFNFESRKTYGNDFTFTVVSRTEKTITIDAKHWGTKRVKIRDCNNNEESILFKCWLVDASDLFDFEIARNNAIDRMNN